MLHVTGERNAYPLEVGLRIGREGVEGRHVHLHEDRHALHEALLRLHYFLRDQRPLICRAYVSVTYQYSSSSTRIAIHIIQTQSSTHRGGMAVRDVGVGGA